MTVANEIWSFIDCLQFVVPQEIACYWRATIHILVVMYGNMLANVKQIVRYILSLKVFLSVEFLFPFLILDGMYIAYLTSESL